MTEKSHTLLGPVEVRELAEMMQVTPTKKLGQNFVVDPNTVRKIVRLAGVREEDSVLEIGPGLGSLTLGITETGAIVTAVEIDHRLATQLAVTVATCQPDAKLDVINADGMQITSLPREVNVLVANLPYNVSVPILMHLLETFPSIQRGLVMVQAEVGHRLAAAPGSKVYGVPSVKAAWYGDWQISGQVSRQIFWPVPNVDSVLVGFEKYDKPIGTEAERLLTFELIDAAFGQRRKMIRQSLQQVVAGSVPELLNSAALSETARPESLSVEDFLMIARAIHNGN